MTTPMPDRLVDVLAELPAAQAARAIRASDGHDLLTADQHFPDWTHDGQDAPPGDWQTWIIMAGRGFGKTRTGAEWVAQLARADGTLRIALVAATLEEARRIMVEGDSGLIEVAGDFIADW